MVEKELYQDSNNIDYERIKEVIIEADKEIKKTEEEDYKRRHPRRSKILGFINGSIYAFIAFLILDRLIANWTLFINGESSFSWIYLLLVSLVSVAAYLSFLVLQQDTFDDNRIEIEKTFTSNISLLALIIAIIALNK